MTWEWRCWHNCYVSLTGCLPGEHHPIIRVWTSTQERRLSLLLLATSSDNATLLLLLLLLLLLPCVAMRLGNGCKWCHPRHWGLTI